MSATGETIDTSVGVAEARNSPEPTSATNERKRPRIDLTGGGRDRKRGKSMFGLALSTLNKAKVEDKERNASEAAKKRQLIEQRLQAKLRKETDSVRRAEEARKEKTNATRKEEELQLKDSIYKLRRTRLPLLANFLITSDDIPSDDSASAASTNPLAPPPRSHPPPLYFLPKILTPAQQVFLDRRKTEVKAATEKEWEAFAEERKTGIQEILEMRKHVVSEEVNQKHDQAEPSEMETDQPTPSGNPSQSGPPEAASDKKDVEMDVAGPPAVTKEDSKGSEQDKKEESMPMQADDDDAVEY